LGWDESVGVVDYSDALDRIELGLGKKLEVQIYIFIYIWTIITINIYVHTIFKSTSEKLSWLDLKIHEVGQQEHIVINGDVTSH
jgi:hypothetical protein